MSNLKDRGQGQLAIAPTTRGEISPPVKSLADHDVDRDTALPFVSLPGKQFSRREPFDWSGDNPDVVLPYQPATAVYENPNGQIIIRQEDQYGDTENEHYLIIDPDQVTKLFTRALSLAAEINARGRE